MTKFTAFAAALVTALGLATAASAVTIKIEVYDTGRPPPNDCAGEFGKPFKECVDPRGSPVLAKWDVDEDEWEFNEPFAGGITADMFTITFDDSEGKSGTWSYNPGTCLTCKAITSYVAKDGDGFKWYYTDPTTPIFAGTWSLEKGLSHLTWYDTELPPIPLPATGLLLLGGLAGLGLYGRRRRAQA